MSDRNWERYKAFFSADATLTTIWQAEPDSAPGIFTSTISEFIAQTGEGPDSQPIFEERMLGSDISVRNNLAQAWVKYEAKFGSPDSLMEWQGTDLFSFIKHQEDWKIVALVYASE